MKVSVFKNFLNGERIATCDIDAVAQMIRRGDYAEAMEYFETSADGNDGLSENSLYYMGEMYEKGLGITADRAKAVECYRRSALRSDKIDSEARLAMARLGEPVESRFIHLWFTEWYTAALRRPVPRANSAHTCFATHLPRQCSTTGPNSTASRKSWDMNRLRQRKYIHISLSVSLKVITNLPTQGL